MRINSYYFEETITVFVVTPDSVRTWTVYKPSGCVLRSIVSLEKLLELTVATI